jgi:hypothetical protein
MISTTALSMQFFRIGYSRWGSRIITAERKGMSRFDPLNLIRIIPAKESDGVMPTVACFS